MAAPIPTPGVSPASFAAGVLRGLGAPLTPQNIAGIVGWAKAEGGHYNGARFNFLNTTEPMPGAGNTGTQGNIKVYNSPQQGIAATVATLRNGHYGGILQALHNSNPRALAAAIGASPWGTSGSLVSQTIGDALGQHFNVPTPVPGQGTPSQSQRAARVSQTTTSAPDWADAGVAAFLKAANKPIDMSGKIHPDNTLNNMISMANANPITTTSTTATQNAVADMTHPHTGAPGAGVQGSYTNPLPGGTLTRTDMGVDATMKPGAMIRAIGDSRVVHIYPNWYQGQPYVLMQLTNGPKAGQYYYVAEAINPTVHEGQHVAAGQPIGSYNPGGTGLELGWGTSGWQTKAQATGATGDSSHGNAPAGVDFRNFLHSVGAKG